MKKLTFGIVILAIFCGCSPTKEQTETVEPVKAHAMPESAAQPAIKLPFELTLSAERSGDATALTAEVRYQFDIAGRPQLKLETAPGTSVKGDKIVELQPGPKGTAAEHTFELLGEDPQAEVHVFYVDSGMGVEVHESYPRAKVRQDAVIDDGRSEFDVPLDFHGTKITRGVEVTP